MANEMSEKKLFFNNLAENWDSRFCSPELKKFLKKFVPMFGLRSGHKVLDVGAGTGVLIPYLNKEIGITGQIVAIDYAKKMIEVCKSKYEQLSNVKFSVSNIEEIDYNSGSFDFVICFGVFPHIENKYQALSQINRVLKRQGKLIIAHAFSSEEIQKHHQSSSSIIAQDHLPDEDKMRKLLAQTGFHRISITDRPGCYICSSAKLLDLN
jgi:demethylmenaquinone methyltransferase/2-methoxy-6-polyprenyl-1,4-benzoquinol methylase